ncbi:MAG: hypothetical protein QOK15_2894 [Nocardioidaceae bacterium]|jgi:hypothetical protein|nr:hypothetical protein [Nocardioidaceae bacterium]
MHTERETIVEILRSGGHHDRAFQAACALPRHIDIEADAALLSQLGVNPGALLEELEAAADRASP